MRGQAPGKLTASCFGERGQEIPVDITETSPGSKKYKFVIKPTKPDMYRITVKRDGNEVKDSPFHVVLKTSNRKQFVQHNMPHVATAPQSSRELAGNLTASGPSRKISRTHSAPSEEARIPLGKRFTVKLKDSQYRMEDVVAEAHGRESGPAMVEMKENDDSSYQVNFDPPKPDHYHIAMLSNGKEIRSFRVHCYESLGVAHVNTYELSDEGSETFEYDIDNPGRGRLTGTCYGGKGQEIPLHVARRSPGLDKYKISISPSEPDVYHISVKSDGKDVGNTPLTVEMKHLSEKTFIAHTITDGFETFSKPDSYELHLKKPESCLLRRKRKQYSCGH
jgi:hypothetical protein